MKSQTTRRLLKRHPLEVTADRLLDHLEKYPEEFDGSDRDTIGHLRFMLQQIAEKHGENRGGGGHYG